MAQRAKYMGLVWQVGPRSPFIEILDASCHYDIAYEMHDKIFCFTYTSCLILLPLFHFWCTVIIYWLRSSRPFGYRFQIFFFYFIPNLWNCDLILFFVKNIWNNIHTWFCWNTTLKWVKNMLKVVFQI